MEKKVNKPQKGAAKKWAEKWEKLRKQQPADELIDKLNKRKQPKKVAQPRSNSSDVEL